MFRRIYWVSEWVLSDGHSEVKGVYTSIPNLVRQGLGHPGDAKLRLTLTKLDSDTGPFGVWEEPHFESLPEVLNEFVKTEEISKDQCQMLINTLLPTAKAA